MPVSKENILTFSNQINSNLIVTTGEEGAFFVEDSEILEFKAPEVNVLDTTGAGDAFVGAFTYGLSIKLETHEAIKFAIDKASLSVTKKGTQSSYSSSE